MLDNRFIRCVSRHMPASSCLQSGRNFIYDRLLHLNSMCDALYFWAVRFWLLLGYFVRSCLIWWAQHIFNIFYILNNSIVSGVYREIFFSSSITKDLNSVVIPTSFLSCFVFVCACLSLLPVTINLILKYKQW